MTSISMFHLQAVVMELPTLKASLYSRFHMLSMELKSFLHKSRKFNVNKKTLKNMKNQYVDMLQITEVLLRR